MEELKPELSKKNKYWIPKHRYYELKHYCLQYPHWKDLYKKLEFKIEAYKMKEVHIADPSNPTERWAIIRADCKRAMETVEILCKESCKPETVLAEYLLKGVTEAIPFTQLAAEYSIPCGKDMYYDCYRRFFYILSQHRGI